MNMEHIRNQENEAEQFAFRRIVGVLQKRFASALAIHNRNPDFRMFVVMPQMTKDDPVFGRIRLTSLDNAEKALLPTEDKKEFFDIGLPLEVVSTENPEIAHLGREGFFMYYPGFSSSEGVVVHTDNFREELPSEFMDLMDDTVVAVPMKQRPLTA